jgi:hypothetical protein
MKAGAYMKRWFRRSQSGQSILILALGFLALLGFVGIVTDVSLMFVRYSTLTRAVDAASIAAAGQVRRQIPFQSEVNDNCTGLGPGGVAWTRSNPCPQAEAVAFARSFGNIGVAARQFIEFYGLNPQSVLIDMCFTVSEKDPVTDALTAIPGLEDDFNELCVGPQGRNAERKLIKVTAQIESPTVFLRLLGFPQITLEASSISETAVLDVVLIMDVSESMLLETTYETWAAEGYTNIYVPPEVFWWNYHFANDTTRATNGFGRIRNHNFADIAGFDNYEPVGSDPYPGDNWYHFRYDLAQRTPDQAQSLLCIGTDCNLGSGFRSPFEVGVYQHPDYGPATREVSSMACRVAYFPYSRNYVVPNSLRTLYSRVGAPWTHPTNKWEGFVPSYNFYRCCNDPNGDGDFSDLLCQPFRQARDATELFLRRIDFLRGDRVAFVTFDRQAFLVNVEVDPAANLYSHMIDNETLALNTLRQSIGVRAEPSFYEPITLSGSRGSTNWRTAVPWQKNSVGDYRSELLLGGHDYEVVNNCPFQDAALEFPYSPVASPPNGNGYGLPYDATSFPTRLLSAAFNPAPDGNGQRMYPRNEGGFNWESLPGYGPGASYDLWASCRGTNVGAALREASNALLDPATTRTNGAVWVMVMLGDGAAGGSDPVFDSGRGLVTEPDDLNYPYTRDDYRVTYGGLGLCPPGTPSRRSELTQFDENPYVFPFCSDEIPEERHFCFDPNIDATIGGERVKLYVDLARCPGNDRYFYDVDDYARDWADWIGLAEPPGISGTTQRNVTQLPTIFTIGFGLNFRDGTTRCTQGSINNGDVGDCLGEELLRYIADVGDNFRIDSDYQQALITNRAGIIGALTNDDFGPRGECEESLAPGVGAADVMNFRDLIAPKVAGVSCGNYYNAPSGDELNRVFDEIASRMFTRLTQ